MDDRQKLARDLKTYLIKEKKELTRKKDKDVYKQMIENPRLFEFLVSDVDSLLCGFNCLTLEKLLNDDGSTPAYIFGLIYKILGTKKKIECFA